MRGIGERDDRQESASEEAQPRLSQPWQRTLAVTALAQTFSILGFAFVTPFLPLYVQELGVHGTTSITFWAAMLSGFVAIGMAIASPIWGVLADRYGRKIMVVRAAGSAALLVGLMGVVVNVYQLLALRLLQGFFTGTVSASQALVASQSPRHRLGFSMGVMQTAIFVGNSMGPLAGGFTAQFLGFRPTFAVAGGLLLMCAILVGFFVHEERETIAVAAGPKLNLIAGMRDALVAPALLSMVFSLFAVQFAITQVYPILPQFIQILQGAAGNAAVATGLVIAGAGAAGAISSTSLGWFSDRIGHRTVLATAALAACFISVPQFFVQATWQLGVLRIFDGFALGAMLPSASAILAGLVPPEKRGAAYGLSAAATSLGFAAGPLTSAAVVALTGIREVFLAAAAVLLFVFIWVRITAPTSRAGSGLERTADTA